jgi:hypothetical protein
VANFDLERLAEGLRGRGGSLVEPVKAQSGVDRGAGSKRFHPYDRDLVGHSFLGCHPIQELDECEKNQPAGGTIVTWG